METIGFPKEEWNQLRNRLSRGLSIYTTRVSAEKGKYKIGKTYRAPWGELLVVKNISRGNDVNQHPFLRELNEKQVKQIERYGDYELIEIVKF